MVKLISDAYLYQVANQGKNLLDYIMTAERVDKNSEGFADIIYTIKHQTNSILLKVLLSNKVVLMMSPKGMSKAFKVIYCRDVKGANKDNKKVFIDCSGVISYENGVYKCKKIGNLVSYLTSAMVYIMYYTNPRLITSNATVMKYGTGAFVDMMLYVLGYLKVPITYADNKERMSFVLAEYFQLCVAGVDSNSDNAFNLAKQISDIKDRKTCEYLHTLFAFTFDEGHAKFDKFLAKFAEVFLGQVEGEPTPRNRTKLTADAFVQRWMYAYDPGTFLGLECFVPFASILTDCYNGSFLNQQNTIEKVVGSKNVVMFVNELLKIGSENA